MIKEYQVTLFCTTGQYRPVSAIVKADSARVKSVGMTVFKRELQTAGIQKICNSRLWDKKHLIDSHYTKVKIREYDKEKIEREKAERYEQIKKERGWA